MRSRTSWIVVLLVVGLMVSVAPAATRAQDAFRALDPPDPRLFANVKDDRRVDVEARDLQQPRPRHVSEAEYMHLTSHPLPGQVHAVSPDGTRVAYRIGDETDEIRVRDVWGGPEVVVATLPPREGWDDPGPVSLSFSPDGSRLAYTVTNEVHVASVDGTSDRVVHRVEDVRGASPGDECDFGDAHDVVWSPRGDRLLVRGFGSCGHVHSVEWLLMRPDGTQVQREVAGGPTSFSPDGHLVASRDLQAADGSDDRYRVTITRVADLTTRTYDVPLANSMDPDRPLEWTPNGEAVYGTLEPDPRSPTRRLGVLEAATGDLTEVAFEDTIVDATVTADGASIVAGVGGDETAEQLVVVDRTTGDRRAHSLPGGGPGQVAVTVDRAVDGGVLYQAGTDAWANEGTWRSALWHLDTRSMTTVRVSHELAHMSTAPSRSPFQPPTVARPVDGPVSRYAGADRTRTAIALAHAVHDRADTVVVARADVYADALAGSTLAGKLEAPLLLTPPDLAGHVRDEVRRLAPGRVVILGDTEAVSAGAERELRDLPSVTTVTRAAGPTRYHTAAAIADHVELPADGAVFLVEGWDPDPNRGWADAVAVAGVAARDTRPVLLTPTDQLQPATADAIRRLGTTQVVIVGGPTAISETVADQVRQLGVDVRRIAGATRYATSRGVAEAYPATGDAAARLWAVTGANWPDALATGPAAGVAGGDLLLVPPDQLGDEATRYLDGRADPPSEVAISGSTAVVGPAVSRQIQHAATR